MKCLIVSFFFIIILNCKSNHASIYDNTQNSITKICPEDGNCTIEVLNNKTLKTLKTSLGETYTEIVDGESIVIKFEYKRHDIPDTVDGQYSEQVLIELDKNNLETEEVLTSKSNVMFARFCYCKGQTGYYRVSQGNLSVKKIEEKTYQLVLDFKQNEVPQIITQIQNVFSLD